MFRFLEDKWEWSALPIRLFLGILFLYTGANKATDIPGTVTFLTNTGFSTAPEFWTYLLIGAELLGGLLLILGLLTRVSATILTIVLLVAIITIHAPNIGTQFFKDLALTGALLNLLLQGPGKLSIDQYLLWE